MRDIENTPNPEHLCSGLSPWQRIEAVIEHYGFTSVNAFAREIKLRRSENLYQIKRGNNGISRELADRISRHFPEVSKAWLLTGEGTMFPGKSNDHVVKIPFYFSFPIGNSMKPDKYLYLSPDIAKDADMATIYKGKAMCPDVPPGAVLFLKKWNDTSNVLFGKIYYVVTKEFAVLRYIRSCSEKGKVRLCAVSDKYDDVTISFNEISRIYLVSGVFR